MLAYGTDIGAHTHHHIETEKVEAYQNGNYHHRPEVHSTGGNRY
jgi:hypothetical protein